MATKSTVKLSQKVFTDLVNRGMNRPMIAKELGIPVRLVNDAFKRWDLTAKRVVQAVEWEDVCEEETVEEIEEESGPWDIRVIEEDEPFIVAPVTSTIVSL